MPPMDDTELTRMLTRMETKLDNFFLSQTDHETRLRQLEKNDIGRIIPILAAIIALVAGGISAYNTIHTSSLHELKPVVVHSAHAFEHTKGDLSNS